MCLAGSLAEQPRKTVEGKKERKRGGEKGRKEGRKKKKIRKHSIATKYGNAQNDFLSA